MILLYRLVRVNNILVFSVEYQDSWRCAENEKPLVHQTKAGIEVMSADHPLLVWAGDNEDERKEAESASEVAVYLRGRQQDCDSETSVLTCHSSAAAEEIERRVVAALEEVAREEGSRFDRDHVRLA